MLIAARKPAITKLIAPGALFRRGDKGGWCDASDIATLKKELAGTTQVAADGDTVGFWGNKVSASQPLLADADTSVRPTWVAATGGVKFTLATPTRALVAGYISTDNAVTCFVVARPSGSGESAERIASIATATGGNDSNTANHAALITRVTTTAVFQGLRNSVSLSSVSMVNGTRQLYESVFDGTFHTMTINGVKSPSVASAGAFNCAIFLLGGYPTLTVGRYDGEVYEVFWINRALSEQETLGVRRYLRQKWGC